LGVLATLSENKQLSICSNTSNNYLELLRILRMKSFDLFSQFKY